jgi:molybdopterin-guanine dinucleotide biosynthesis protein A
MGSDKARLRHAGETQLGRTVQLLEAAVERVFVSTRPDQEGDTERGRFEQIVDRYDDMGPLAGILSALDEYAAVSWLVVACDLPNIDGSTIAYLLEHCSAEHHATAFISEHDGLPEPLCAIYRPAARPVINAFVARKIICPRKILLNSATHLLAQPNPGALHNVNSPGDLAGTAIEAAR